MRALIVIILIAAGLYGGYWFVGSSAVENGLKTWLDERNNDGWVAEYDSLDTVGFPSRFDTTVTNLELADPNTGVLWSTPQFDILALSYRPNEIIAQWPAQQTLATPLQKITIDTSKMTASVAFDADTDLVLNRSTFDLQNVSMQSDLGWTMALTKGLLATRQTEGRENAHDIFFEATDFKPAEQARIAIDTNGVLPDVFEQVKVDATVGFDAPWDRFAIESQRPQPTFVNLKLAQATWGQLDLKAAGEFTVDAQGTPNGSITIKATNWREMLQIAAASGMIPQGTASTLESALGLLAGFSGNPNTLDAPLTFAKGNVLFGPIPLGPAPRFVIR